MKHIIQSFVFISTLLCMLSLTACGGYQFAGKMPSVVGDGTKTLKVKSISYPTLHPWLVYTIRSSLRDEINAKHLAKWVDSGTADYELSIKVLSFRTTELMRQEDNTAMLYDTSMHIEATLYDRSNKEVWHSGPLYYADRIEQPNEKDSASLIVTQLMRMLADKMRNTF